MRISAYTSRRAAGCTAAAALAIAALVLTACASKANTNGTGALGSVTGSPTTSPTVTSGGTATSTPTATATVTASSATTTTKPAGPTIEEFSVKQQPTCPVVATSDAPFSAPGTDIILHWSVSGGATGVGISLDDPNFAGANNGSGTIGNYATSGDLDLAFVCDITSQPNTVHKYTLSTIGGGKMQLKTLTVTKQTSP